MKRHTLTTFGAGLLVGGSLFMGSTVRSQQESGQPSMEQVYEMWEKMAKPGPEHARLARMAGKWTQTSKHWESQESDPVEYESVAEYRTILGGRFLTESMSGQIPWGGQPTPFEGYGVIGFDNMRQKHFFVWFDTMGTMYMLAEGDADPSGKVITYYSDMPDPMDGNRAVKVKSVSKMIDDDHSVFEMYMQTPDGGWFKNLEVDQTRAR